MKNKNMLKYSKEINKIIEDIKSLKIQGARNIAKETTKAFILFIEQYKGKNPSDLAEKAFNLSLDLMNTRPTEPMARNIIKEVLNFLLNIIIKENDVEQTKQIFLKNKENILNKFYESIERVSEIGSNYIEDNSKIITYCHSSTVTSILKKAHDKGKNIEVITCETRPRYQGRITAKELSEYGIKTTHIVDGAMARFSKDCDLALIGGDAITSSGDLLNKIGSLSLAIVMKHYGKPLLSAVEIYKYDPQTLFGFREVVEEREKAEVWDLRNKNLIIRNPAFDLVPHNLISKYITDAGIILPSEFTKTYEENKSFLRF